MDVEIILKLVKLRFVVYEQGAQCGLWKSLEENGAKEMLDYIFPKTGKIAFYNLMLETVTAAHKDYIPTGEYGLFKLPVQYEAEILGYLKSYIGEDIWTIPEDRVAYLQKMATVDCQSVLNPVNLGSLKDAGLENIMSLCAFHYLNIFQEGTNSYPYFG